MRDFACPQCGQQLAFENSVCLNCGNAIGFDLAARDFAVLGGGGTTVLEPARKMCANLHVAACNWLVPVGGEPLCRSCSLTRTRPVDGDPALPAFAEAEAAKRRLVVELVELRLPINDRVADPEKGLTFDLLSSQQENVITGHDSGVITLDLAEGDDVHREQLRISMDEPYRTLLGHFRHETGHYFFFVLAEAGPARQEFESLFGDPDLDYQEALDRHYSQGAPEGWEETYVSSYATMHPAEDWAETFAHYLHIRDTMQTARSWGIHTSGPNLDLDVAWNARLAVDPVDAVTGFDEMTRAWIAFTFAMNAVNDSMGHGPLYPFALNDTVLQKLRFVHDAMGVAA
jgi:hypothetical protein